jgi:plasmid stabilization system protein ParE
MTDYQVLLSRAADYDLVLIWSFNAEQRGLKQADEWDAFLRRSIREIG